MHDWLAGWIAGCLLILIQHFIDLSKYCLKKATIF